MLGKKRGQSTLEYALIIAVVVSALIVINLYMKKGVLGRLKESTDQVGRQFDSEGNFSNAWQTASSSSSIITESRNTTYSNTTSAGAMTTNITQGENITRADYETWGTNVTQHYP